MPASLRLRLRVGFRLRVAMTVQQLQLEAGLPRAALGLAGARRRLLGAAHELAEHASTRGVPVRGRAVLAVGRVSARPWKLPAARNAVALQGSAAVAHAGGARPARRHFQREVYRTLVPAPLELRERRAGASRKVVQYRLDLGNQAAGIERLIGADEQCARDQVGAERMLRSGAGEALPELLLERQVTVEPSDPEAVAPSHRRAKSNARVAGPSAVVHALEHPAVAWTLQILINGCGAAPQGLCDICATLQRTSVDIRNEKEIGCPTHGGSNFPNERTFYGEQIGVGRGSRDRFWDQMGCALLHSGVRRARQPDPSAAGEAAGQGEPEGGLDRPRAEPGILRLSGRNHARRARRSEGRAGAGGQVVDRDGSHVTT